MTGLGRSRFGQGDIKEAGGRGFWESFRSSLKEIQGKVLFLSLDSGLRRCETWMAIAISFSHEEANQHDGNGRTEERTWVFDDAVTVLG